MKALLSFFLLLVGLAARVPAQTQTLGPWTVSAPDTASLVTGGGSLWSALNVSNASLSVGAAFTGLPLDDDGYANADAGTTVEVGFSSGVINGAGADIVIFEAQFDHGTYELSSDYDGFTATATAFTSGATVVSSKDYYYMGGGPFTADVVGVEVDLSALGVPAGAVVYGIRFTSLYTACDPIGLGRIVHGPDLAVAPLPLIPGAPATLTVTGASSHGKIAFAYSKAGPGPYAAPVPGCGPMLLLMTPPITVLAVKTASATGASSLTGFVPPGLSGSLLFLQAVDVTGCAATNMVLAPVL